MNAEAVEVNNYRQTLALVSVTDTQSLGLEVQQLKEKTASLEDLLRMSRHTISTLQGKLRELQANYDRDMDTLRSQVDIFQKVMADIENDNNQEGDIVIPRKEFAKAMGRVKAQESLEGRSSRDMDNTFKDTRKQVIQKLWFLLFHLLFMLKYRLDIPAFR